MVVSIQDRGCFPVRYGCLSERFIMIDVVLYRIGLSDRCGDLTLDKVLTLLNDIV